MSAQHVTSRLKSVLVRLGDWQLKGRVALKRAFGMLGPFEVIAYPGYGARGEVRIKARVVERKHIRPTGEQATFLHDMRNMYRRLTRMPIPNARVAVTCLGRRREVLSDGEGFIDVRFRPWAGPGGVFRPAEDMWLDVGFELLSPRYGGSTVRSRGRVLMPPDCARFVVISDIDDTILPTRATDFLRMMRSLFTGNARTRLPFPGVGALYRGLHAGDGGEPCNPMLYVSRGPWNLFDLLSEFFNLHDIPVGPVLYLRDWGLSEEGMEPARPRGHKFRCIEDMLDVFADWPVVLMGDSGQLDPWIYAEVVRAHPGRVLAVYIRKVPGADAQRLRAIGELARETREAGCAFMLADDSQEMARHAVESGLVARERLIDLVEEKVLGEEPPTLLSGETEDA
jgi:phosphatidate phosphatase APP1